MWAELIKWAQQQKQPWQMTIREFQDALVFHGTDQDEIKGGMLQRYMASGGDYGAIFTSKDEEFVRNFLKTRKMYRAFIGDRKLIDLTHRGVLRNIKNWVGEKYVNYDGEEVQFGLNDYNFMSNDGTGASWATFDNYNELFMKHGYSGAIVWETPAVKTIAIFEGNVPVWEREKSTVDIHKELVEKALKEGKPVPPRVLEEYPELQQGQSVVSNNVE